MEKMHEFGLKESGEKTGGHNYFVKALTLEEAWKKLATKLNKPVKEVCERHYLCYKNLSRGKAVCIPHRHRTFID